MTPAKQSHDEAVDQIAEAAAAKVAADAERHGLLEEVEVVIVESAPDPGQPDVSAMTMALVSERKAAQAERKAAKPK